MNWIGQLNHSIEYIESNMDKTIKLTTVSRIAGCSPYHYQRMFSLIAEITLGEYIRKRRLTLVAYGRYSGAAGGGRTVGNFSVLWKGKYSARMEKDLWGMVSGIRI